MYKKKLSIAIGLSFLFAMIIGLATSGTISAQQCRIVELVATGEDDSIKIEPEPLLTTKGDCVVWFNRAGAEGIKIIFEDAKKCEVTTQAPMGFTKDSAGCYVGNWIPFSGTTSLTFMEKGTYEYVVVARGREDKKVKGHIQVE
jgi:hypothetical protein